MAEESKYCIKVPGALAKVSEEVYLAYFRERRRWFAQSEREYAETIGLSQNAVNKRRHKVLAKLRRLIKI